MLYMSENQKKIKARFALEREMDARGLTPMQLSMAGVESAMIVDDIITGRVDFNLDDYKKIMDWVMLQPTLEKYDQGKSE